MDLESRMVEELDYIQSSDWVLKQARRLDTLHQLPSFLKVINKLTSGRGS